MENLTRENMYHNLYYDWDGELMNLDGEDLWDIPNNNSRKIRKMVVEECFIMKERIKKLSFWRRLLNKF